MSMNTSADVQSIAPTRRQVITGMALGIGGLALGSAAARAAEGEEIRHGSEAIHQEVTFKAGRQGIYDALTDAKQFDRVTHLGEAMQSGMALPTHPTAISREAGGPFTLFGGHIVGRQIELVPNERIVQAWRVVTWAPGIYSIARFELADQGGGTKLVFDHTGFPAGQGQYLADGWRGNYWQPLEKFLL
jgi:activator of HSP90 ATPase